MNAINTTARTNTITAHLGTATGNLQFSGSAIVSTWSPVLPSDDIGVRAAKLERNLDSLRTQVDEMRKIDLDKFRKTTDALTERIADLDVLVAQRHKESRQATTAAMRWEVRGLLVTLVGAGLSVFG